MLNALPHLWPDYEAWPLDAAVAVPLHPAREATRGYNQARLLVEPLADAWGIQVLDDAVRRVRDTQPQMSLNAKERQKNVHAAFLGEAGQVSGLDLLLVDDVRTTGATLAACALALAEAGAKSVRVLTLANAVSSGIPSIDRGP
jgi:ComF family protein